MAIELDLNLNGAIDISRGGTNADNAADARTNLDILSSAEVTSTVTFESLNANSDIGTASDQVAAGDHEHSYYLRSDQSDNYAGGTLQIDSDSVNGHYWSAGLTYDSGWVHTSTNSYGFALNNDGPNGLKIHVAQEGGIAAATAPINTYRFKAGAIPDILVGPNKVWHEGNDGHTSGLDADLIDGTEGTYVVKSPYDIGVDISDDWNDWVDDSYVTTAVVGTTDKHGPDNPSDITRLYNLINVRHRGGEADGNLFGGQLAWGSTGDYDNLQYRSHNNGTWMPWVVIWNSANDGTGSGLDADLLDGIDSEQFLRSDVDDTCTGILTLSADAAYPLQIDTTSDAKILLTGSAAPYIRFQSGGLDKSFIQYNAGEFVFVNQNDGAILKLKDDISFSSNNGANFYSMYHAGNSNLTSVDWNADTLTALNVSLDNGLAAGGQILFNSAGYSSWYIDNVDGELRFSRSGGSTYANFTPSGYLHIGSDKIYMHTSSSRVKYAVWYADIYGMGFDLDYSFGPLIGDAITFQTSDSGSRGFWWGDDAHTNEQGAMALDTAGRLTTAAGIRLGYGQDDITSPKLNDLEVAGDVYISDDVKLSLDTFTLATITQTSIFSFDAASFSTCKLVVQAFDTVSGEYHSTELLIVNDGTTASAVEYGTVYTGTAPLADYEVDVNSGDVRLLATGVSTNSTEYKISNTTITA